MDADKIISANEIIKAIIPAVITGFITIIGFIVTALNMRKNFRAELRKKKTEYYLKKLEELYDLQVKLLDTIMAQSKLPENKRSDLLKDFGEALSSTFAYGSCDLIAITAKMQEQNYMRNQATYKPDGQENISHMHYNILLLCQLKYDLTGERINPEQWYRMRFSDYSFDSDFRMCFVKANNKTVMELGLQKFLMIKIGNRRKNEAARPLM